jgi:4-hydroxybenzoate polyprenyltransferase
MAAGDRPRQRTTPLRDTSRERSWRRSARGYFLLPHIVPVVVVELATAAFAVIAWDGLPPAELLGPLLLGMLGGQLAIGATNELVDLPFDAVGKPTKPLPSGDVSIRGARFMVVGGLVIMVVCGLRLGTTAFALLALGTGLGVAYNFWFKRTTWSWLPYLLALPLLPIWVFSALGKPEPRLLLLYPLGSIAALGVHLAQALPDTAIDREAGLQTITSRSGHLRTFVLAWLATLSAPVLAWVAADWLGADRPYLALAFAAGLALLSLLVNVILIVANRRIGTAACFPLVAVATAGSALAWTLTVVR